MVSGMMESDVSFMFYVAMFLDVVRVKFEIFLGGNVKSGDLWCGSDGSFVK